MLRAACLLAIPAAVMGNQCDREYNIETPTGQDFPIDNWKTTWRAPNMGSDYMDPDSRFPNGFRRAQIYAENDPPFCLEVDDTENHMVKVMVEADTEARVCIVSQDYDELAPGAPSALMKRCDIHQVQACFPAPTDKDFKLMVYCESGCPEGETPFMYKVFKSMRRDQINPDNSALDNIDMWCMNVDGDEPSMNLWPSELGLDIPDEEAIPDYIDKASDATALAPRILMSLAPLAALAF